MEPHLTNAGDEERYAYMFKCGDRRLLFIRHFGAGMESVAQLVKDVDSGENLVRKVPSRRLVHFLLSDKDRRLKKPNEIRMLRAIKKTFKAPEPGFPFYISVCYGHEFIRSKYPDGKGRQMFHSASYWKLCNGESVRSRWLFDCLYPPPASLIARMIRQVLSTLHYLYTAGEQPLYHDDLHLGNVWIHWPSDTALPDFYMGDFGEAGFADSKFQNCSFAEQICIAHAVNDLDKFSFNVENLITTYGRFPGYAAAYGQVGLNALGLLVKAMRGVVTDWETAANTLEPPDLKRLIQAAKDVEEIFGKGGDVDETQSKAYTDFVTAEREVALQFQQEEPLIVSGSKQEALRPMVMDGPGKSLLPIYGPWQLVTVDGHPAEGEGVTHHRPNEGRFHPGEPNLSVTHRPYGILEPVFLEPDSGRCSQEPTPPFASGVAGGDRVFHSAVDRRSPSSTAALSWELVEDDSAFHTNLDRRPLSWEDGDDVAFQRTLGRRSPSSPGLSWQEGDDAVFRTAPNRLPAAVELSSSIFFSCFSCEERAWAFQTRCRATVQKWDDPVETGIIDRQSVQKRDKTRFSHFLKAGGNKPRFKVVLTTPDGRLAQAKHAVASDMVVVGLNETAFDFSDPEGVII